MQHEMNEQARCSPDRAADLAARAGSSTGAHAGHARKAFTLVEMLVAVGAVALVSVGLAAVFKTVGQTVTTGKRVSALTQQAAVLESQMRQDFKNMSRDGFLVIRHQFTLGRGNNGQTLISVPRFPGDPVPARPRRIDEILFFANGEYQTAREDLIPGRTAKSRTARIYYGHGQKATPQTPEQAANFRIDMNYLNPTFGDWFRQSDNLSTRLGEVVGNNTINRYASSWNLIRQATLLTRPTTVSDGGWPEDRPRPLGWDSNAAAGTSLTNLCSDSTFQIAGQPAANSIFRSHNEMFPMASKYSPAASVQKFTMYWEQGAVGTNVAPRVGSGVVDIAATDLDEIAMIVNGSRYSPGDLSNNGESYFAGRTSGLGVLEAPLPLMNGWLDSNSKPAAFFASSYVVPAQPNNLSGLSTTAARMQAWMINAMPTPSGYSPTVYSQDQNGINNGDGVVDRLGYRVRCEDELPDVRGTMDNPKGRNVQILRNNLLSIGLSKIAARCSEFVVEWSFGQTYPTTGNFKDEFGTDVRGQTIWFGRTLAGFGANGSFAISNTPGAANPDIYRYDPAATYGAIGGKYNASGTKTLQAPTASPAFKPYKGAPEFAGNLKLDDYVVPDWLTHGMLKWRQNGLDQSSLISYFGYFDPTYTQDDITQPPSLPWAWPKMVRVTFTLADAADPSIEQTFQYVFDLPPDPKP